MHADISIFKSGAVTVVERNAVVDATGLALINDVHEKIIICPSFSWLLISSP